MIKWQSTTTMKPMTTTTSTKTTTSDATTKDLHDNRQQNGQGF